MFVCLLVFVCLFVLVCLLVSFPAHSLTHSFIHSLNLTQSHSISLNLTQSHSLTKSHSQWKCDAQLPKEYKLVETTVSCEGYDYPDDPYILAGSCGVSFWNVRWVCVCVYN